MCTRSVSLALLGFILMLQAAVPAMANDWQVVYKSDNLRVSKRDYAGSALDEIKGQVRVKASLNAVMALLKEFGCQQIIDLGDIITARGTEMYLPLWLRLWGALGTGVFNVKIVQ